MSETCRFCKQEYANPQALRAHLKGCVVYRNRPQGESAGIGSPIMPGNSQVPGNFQEPGNSQVPGPPNGTEFDLVKQLEKQVAAERLRLTLREIEETHAELDRKAVAKERERNREAERQFEARQEAEDEDSGARAQDERERRDRERHEAAAYQRRRLIQEVKEIVVKESPIEAREGTEIGARILREVERALSPLALDELPRDELFVLARAARDKVCRAAEKVQKEKRDAEFQAQQRARELADRKQRLIRQGVEYAKRELESVEGLSALECWRIELLMQRKLQKITGNESWPEIVDGVEEILESEGIEYDDFDDEE